MIDVCKQAESRTTLIGLKLAAMAPVFFETKVQVRRLISQLSLGPLSVERDNLLKGQRVEELGSFGLIHN